MDKYRLTVLGCRGSFPVEGPDFAEFGGATSCYILRSGDYALIIDCGTGLSSAAAALEGCTKVDVILTHLHYDHILGFLYPADIPDKARRRLFVYTPEGKEPEDPLAYIKAPYWPITPQFAEVGPVRSGTPLQLNEELTVHLSPANHPGDSAIIRVDTGDGSFSLMCDWEHGAIPVPRHMSEGCSFIIYDGTFTDEEYAGRGGWGHSTWREGIRFAKERGVPRLLISHHSPQRTDSMLREMEQQAQNEFPATRFMRMWDKYDMRGELL